MTSPRTTRPIALSALAFSVALLSGCVSAPGPTPSTTAAFASEEEAFAAAEETYRAYNEAVNAERSGVSGSNPNRYLTGEMLETEVEAKQELDEAGIHLAGPTKVVAFEGVESDYSRPVATIEAHVCLDITEARAIDASGEDVTAPERSDIYVVKVTFTGTSNMLLISDYQVAEGSEC